MKLWITIALITAVLVVGGIGIAKAVPGASAVQKNSESEVTCTNCPTGGCSAERNCGLSTCGTTQEKSCGCGR